jgi:hypothetical protein
MLTPRFKITQTDDDITLKVHAPYTDVNESEVHVEERLVCFYAAPYYLRFVIFNCDDMRRFLYSSFYPFYV